MFILFGLILTNSLPDQYVVVKLPNEGTESKNPEKIQTDETNIDGDDYASNIVGGVSGSKITLGCENDVGVYGHITNSEIEYQCEDQMKRFINVSIKKYVRFFPITLNKSIKHVILIVQCPQFSFIILSYLG